MEFNEKLQQLRKQKGLTQEKLSEELYVSRTAVSKWESGKGYPNIESLKSISKLFSVSIDDLLSSDELILLAESENHANMFKVFGLIFAILDLMLMACIFLPLYGQQDGEFVHSVTLLAFHDSSEITRTVYFAVSVLLSAFGVFELILQRLENGRLLAVSKTCSIILHALAILIFVLTRQPYAASFVFMLFMIKIVLLITNSRVR